MMIAVSWWRPPLPLVPPLPKTRLSQCFIKEKISGDCLMKRAILVILYFVGIYFICQISFIDTVPNPFGPPTPEQESIMTKMQWHP